MSWLDSLATPPIGLDIGSRLVKAAQLGKSHGQTVIAASVVLGRSRPDTPVNADEARRIARVLKQQGFAGRRVVLATPTDQLMSAVIDMPPKDSGAPLDVIAAQEFGRLQRQQPGRFEVCWWPVPRPARSTATKIMAVGCAHADSEPFINAFTSCGLDVASLDSGFCAAVRACLESLDSSAGVSAVLDIGWSSSRLALVYQGAVIFDRVLNGAGLAKMQERVCLALGVEPVEADALLQAVGLLPVDASDTQVVERKQAVAPQLRRALATFLSDIATELDTSFEYAGHQYPDAEPRRLVLAGGGGAVPGLAEQLNPMVTPEVIPAVIPPTKAQRGSRTSGRCHGPDNSAVPGALLLTALGLAGLGGGC